MENTSFRTTVLPLADRLYRLALRITMNRAEAEDVVQDTLLKVWERRSEWEQISNPEAFAMATCRNRALDIVKRAGRNTKSLDEVETSHLSPLTSQPSLEAREQLSLVRRLMDSLPEVQRTIMLLRDIEGRTYQEIAQVLDISETQVKVYLHRARTKVKKELDTPGIRRLMDYKYIEQLLERYWECQTTLEEEAILRTFFRQEDVPASLLPYRQLFAEEDAMAGEHLPEDFRNRMLRLAGEVPAQKGTPEGIRICKARRLTLMHRLRPFYRAAGLVAILLTIGNAAYQSLSGEDAAVPQTAESIGQDTLQHITIGSPRQQSAELTAQPTDTLDAFTR